MTFLSHANPHVARSGTFMQVNDLVAVSGAL